MSKIYIRAKSIPEYKEKLQAVKTLGLRIERQYCEGCFSDMTDEDYANERLTCRILERDIKDQYDDNCKMYSYQNILSVGSKWIHVDFGDNQPGYVRFPKNPRAKLEQNINFAWIIIEAVQE